MNLPEEERKRRRNERLKKKRRADGINPRPPAMTKEERKSAGVVAARRYRARQSASQNPVAAIGQTNSGVKLTDIVSTDEQRVAIAGVVAELAVLPVASIWKVEQALRKVRLSVVVKEPSESRVGGVAADIVADPPVNRRSEAAKKREVKLAALRRVENIQKYTENLILQRGQRTLHNAELQDRIALLHEKKAAASSLLHSDPELEQTLIEPNSVNAPTLSEPSPDFSSQENARRLSTESDDMSDAEFERLLNAAFDSPMTEVQDEENKQFEAELRASRNDILPDGD